MQDAGNPRIIRILVVDDHEINRLVASEILLSARYCVECVASGDEALEILKARPNDFDLLFLDIQMPGLDGYRTSEKIRDELRIEHMAIIAMSASNENDDRARCFVAGINDFVAKPLNPKVMIDLASKKIRQISILKKLVTLDNESLCLSRAMVNLNLNYEILRRTVTDFSERFSTMGVKVRDSLAAQDDQSARQAVHSLSGTSGNIGAMKLHLAAKALEEAIVKKDTALLDPLLLELETELDLLIGTQGNGYIGKAIHVLSGI